MKYALFESEAGSNVTVLHDGELLVAASTHPNWQAILTGLRADDEKVFDLFDVGRTIEKNFRKVTDRVSVRNGQMFLDGDVINNALSNKVFEFMNSGEQDYLPLVRFFENIQANPNDHSRTQAYEWLSRHGFALDDDGNIVAYKAVRRVSAGVYKSMHSGHAIVNGVEVNGEVQQKVGDVVEMPRSEVQHNPSQGCHTGLHVGNWRFVTTFGGDAIVLVRVNPRDIVSVPTDSNWEKVRVCRYEVLAESDGTELGQRWTSAPVPVVDEDDDEEEDYCDWCGEYDCDGDCDWDDEDDDDEPTPVVTRPTNLNYQSQPRDSKGHFIPKHRA